MLGVHEKCLDWMNTCSSRQEGEMQAFNLLVESLLGEHSERHANILAEVIVHSNEVERRGDEDHRIGALHG